MLSVQRADFPLSPWERGQLVDGNHGWIMECADDIRATLSPAPDFKGRPDQAGAVMHDTQAHPTRCRDHSGKAYAVIVHHERQSLWQHCECDGDMLRLPV